MVKKPSDLVKELEAHGYKVSLAKPTVKKTFEVEIENLKAFQKIVNKKSFMVKVAINEAIADWVKKKS